MTTIGVSLAVLLIVVITSFSWPRAATWWTNTPETFMLVSGCSKISQTQTVVSHVSLEEMNVKPPQLAHCISSVSLTEISQAVRISDALALLGILVATVGLGLPLLAYVSFSVERKKNRTNIDEKFRVITEGVAQQLSREIGPQMKLIAFARVVASKYVIERILGEGDSNVTSVILESHEIEACLIELLDESSFNDALGRLENYINPSEVNEEQFYLFLRDYFKNLYRLSFVLGDKKRDIFFKFTKEKLKMSLHEITMT